MEPRLQRRVQRYGWDKAAGSYEQSWHRQLALAQERLLEVAKPRAGERVLDVACGTGLVTFPVADLVSADGAVVGTDLSDEMVDACRQAAATRGCGNATFQRMGAEELQLEDDSFELALCSLGLMYVPEPVQALREMHRVLKPVGRMAVLVWGQRSKCGWAEIFPIVDARVKSEVCPLFFQLGGEGVLEHALTAAGFSDIRGERLSSTLAYSNGEEACLAAFAGGPVALAYDRFDEKTRGETHAEYLASIAAFKRGAGYEIPAEFVLAWGEKPILRPP